MLLCFVFFPFFPGVLSKGGCFFGRYVTLWVLWIGAKRLVFFFGFVRFVCAANTYLDFLLHEVDSFLRFCGAMHMGGRGCVMDYGSVTWHTSTKVSNNKVYIQYIHVLTVKK